MNGTKITVLIADDHDIVRAGIRHLLQQPDIEVVGEASDGRGVVQLAERLAPNVVILDIAMPNLNGIEAGSQILRRDHKTGVIILSMHEEEDYLMRALAVGVRAYLLKESAQTDLVPAVRAVAGGKTYFSPPVAQMLADDFGRQLQQRGLSDSYDLLTEREREILQLIAEGKSNKEAAAVLRLSPYTVETHRTHIMQKLDLHNTAEIVLYAVRKKIIV